MYYTCKKCENPSLERVKRSWWMHGVPALRLFRCFNCGYTCLSTVEKVAAASKKEHIDSQMLAVENAHDQKSINNEAGDRDVFYVKMDDSTYGPVPMRTLLEWAQAGRVHGKVDVSCGTKDDWHAAHKHKVLHFIWKVGVPHYAESFLMNPKGVATLVKMGRVHPDSIVTILPDGKSIPVQEAVQRLELAS